MLEYIKKSLSDMIDFIVFQKIIRFFIFKSWLGRRSMFGYADSGNNFDHIYRNNPRGYTLLGKFVDKILLNLPACKATRERFSMIIRIIDRQIKLNDKKGRHNRIVDLASGSSRYLIDCIPENATNIEILCMDFDNAALKQGKKNVGSRPIIFKRANALLLKNHLNRLAIQKNWTPNIVIVSGLYEYYSDDIVRTHLQQIIKYLSKDGVLLAITQKGNPNRYLMEKLGKQKNGNKWILNFRKPELIEEWLSDAGYVETQVTMDKWNQYVYFLARKEKNCE